jgi:hypothetical protein
MRQCVRTFFTSSSEDIMDLPLMSSPPVGPESFFRRGHRFFQWVQRASSGEAIAFSVGYKELLLSRPMLY